MLETLESDFEVLMAVSTTDFLNQNEALSRVNNLIEVNERELSAIGSFKTNNTALLVVKMKPNIEPKLEKGFTLALDGINDPGNLGAIIRIADWYRIKQILASNDTVDLYNPKVIAASKGSFNRVDIFYTELQEYLSGLDINIYGAFMNGESVHKAVFPDTGIIIMGNEANGISPEVEKLVNHKITIPRFGGAESLNVAMATAIICDNALRTTSIPYPKG